MKKLLFSLFIIFYFTSKTRSQDLGYTTIDIGGDYQWNADASGYSLLVAFNAKIHHSIFLRAGYLKVQSNTNAIDNSEKGNGWSASIGYRFYPSVLPKRFFIGAKVEASTLKINWSKLTGAGTSNVLIVQPSMETGYTILINDLFFITPSIAAAFQHTVKTNGSPVVYGNNKIIPVIGLSSGFRF